MPETKVRTQVQQQPVQILQGPKHRDDGYQIREEWGLPMNDAAYDEAKGIDHPRIWTAERDIEMWKALES